MQEIVLDFFFEASIDDSRIPRIFASGVCQYSATITVQENDGLYQWLMQFGDRIRVISPENVREKLKQRLLDALKLLQ